MTAATHQSGTDRINEVAGRLQYTHIINIQGDEPCIDHDILKAFSAAVQQIDDNSLLTLVGHATIEEKLDPNVVKAVLNRDNSALYFSRAPVPFEREGAGPCFKHMGIYGFTVKSLQRFCSFPPGILERTERLEQLRALEYGMKIQCIIHDFESIGIDTPEDLEQFRRRAPEYRYGN
jgi:3-deoxy-manno-octulosonate cytidylyltransferase (CMP-KDO synthetase)